MLIYPCLAADKDEFCLKVVKKNNKKNTIKLTLVDCF